MSTTKFVGKILVILHLLALAIFAQRLDPKLDDQNDSIMWENMLPDLQPPIPMSLPMNYLASIGEHQFVFTEPQLMFPKLTSLQRDFGVNPGYQTYNEPKTSIHKQLDSQMGTPVGDNGASGEGDDQHGILQKYFDSRVVTKEDIAVVEAVLDQQRIYDIYFTTIVAISSALLAFIIVGAGICFHRYQIKSKSVKDVEYPSMRSTGSGKHLSPTSTDRKLAQNAQLFHFQQQKQQMIGRDTNNSNVHRANGLMSDNDSDEEEGDFTVYECPGLAPAGEMEVRNPIFDEETPKVSK